MSQRDDYEPGVPCWVDTLQPDPDAAMGFYAELFGWEFEGPGEMPGDPPGRYYVARLRGRDVAGVGSLPAGAAPAPGWGTYVYVADADATAAAAREHGGEVLVEPVDAPPAGRLALLADPAGAAFGVWQPAQRKGAQLVNEPGAWTMSTLTTPDVDGAAAFYGALFGWTTETFEMGDFAATMFRLPGYVGGEPQQPVSREVIAAMAAVPGAPAQWGPGFWDHDVDETAAKAQVHGGRVVAPAVDSPAGRTVFLADPYGATFSITNAPR
jgi:hypothetical protein